MLEWPVSVDWQSPDCKSQILMVLSRLLLAICFPSGLYATERTLKLREVITRSNRTREANLEKLTISSARSPSTRSVNKKLEKEITGMSALSPSTRKCKFRNLVHFDIFRVYIYP